MELKGSEFSQRIGWVLDGCPSPKFLGGSFYSISMLALLWQKVTLLNPVVYLISGFR